MNVKQLQMLQIATDAAKHVDIKNVKIDMSASAHERAQQYFAQIKNPYAFRCGNVRINVAFSSSGKTLMEAMTSYISEGMAYK